ncbi:MAG: methyltransferase domain-containing protein [Candidatus Omnitrophica bacterium]|nr:methyltransferase domain-containing protein [Candidatus Omnitrophota bacterium]
MEKYLSEYLEHLGMKGKYTAENIPCEICGSKDLVTVREIISIGKDAFGKLPVVSCKRCGYLFQGPRFNKKFYDDYYSLFYRNVVKGAPDPDQAFIEDQKERGRLLFKRLERYFPERGAVLDVGCSVGTMLIPFIERGWDAYGTDPDIGFVRYGREKMGLPVEAVGAEEMVLSEGRYDFIMILGSLEHVFDPNLTLRLCRKASSGEGLLLLEGRGHPQSASRVYFNHNHHRYFTFNSIELIMMKHGWKPFMTTDEPICGPTRPGGIYSIGKVSDIPSGSEFLDIIESGKREDPQVIIAKYDELDRVHGAK